jgi:hypothetical protein
MLDSLAHVAQILTDIKIPFAVGGSFASSTWGYMRTTQDIDLVVLLQPTSLELLLSRLEWPYFADQDHLRKAVCRPDPFESGCITNGETGDRIDLFLLADTDYTRGLLDRAVSDDLINGPNLPIVSAEDIVIAKLRWYRLGGEVSDRQWNDVVGVLEVQRPHLDLAYLRHWADHFAILDLTEEALSEVERHPRSP